MKKILAVMLLAITLTGCSGSHAPPPAPVKVVQVKDLTPPPDVELMSPSPSKKLLVKGMTNAEVTAVLRENNLRNNSVEIKYEALQQYVCNLFPSGSAGPVCIK